MGTLVLSGSKIVKYPHYRIAKQMIYLFYILALPLRIPYLPLLYLVAIALSVYERHGRLFINSKDLAKLFLEEEALNISLIVMLVMCGPFYRTCINIMLGSWAFL